MRSREVFVRLLDEGVDVWRPTSGEIVTPSTVRLAATPSYDPGDEEWEFLPGAIVECEARSLGDGTTGFVAVREVGA